jgi:hypothetical protein
MHYFLDWNLCHPSSLVLDLNTIVLAYAVYFETPIPSLMYKSRWVEKLMGFDHNSIPPSESVLMFDFASNLTCRISSCGSFFKFTNGRPPVDFLVVRLVLAMLILFFSFGTFKKLIQQYFMTTSFQLESLI